MNACQFDRSSTTANLSDHSGCVKLARACVEEIFRVFSLFPPRFRLPRSPTLYSLLPMKIHNFAPGRIIPAILTPLGPIFRLSAPS
jgi:hypothetical protein